MEEEVGSPPFLRVFILGFFFFFRSCLPLRVCAPLEASTCCVSGSVHAFLLPFAACLFILFGDVAVVAINSNPWALFPFFLIVHRFEVVVMDRRDLMDSGSAALLLLFFS